MKAAVDTPFALAFFRLFCSLALTNFSYVSLMDLGVLRSFQQRCWNFFCFHFRFLWHSLTNHARYHPVINKKIWLLTSKRSFELERYIWVIDQVWVQEGWILAKFFFCAYLDRDEVEVHKPAKKEIGQYPAILTEQTWSIKDLLYGFRGNVSCGIQWVVPSGQDCSILPARVANLITSRNLVHLARSRS